MAEITDTGFQIKTQNEYFDEEKQLYLDVDPDWNLDTSTPDYLKIASDAETLGNLDETAERAYNSKDPSKVEDEEQDILCAITGTVRSKGTPSVVTSHELSGVAGTVILAGKKIKSTVDGTEWALDDDAIIESGGTVIASTTCTTTGAIQANIGTINEIVDTVGGWQSATNLTVATSGMDKQSNASLRIERDASVSRPGNNQIDNLISELFSVENVRRVKVLENFTDVTDTNGLPGHSQAPIVDGGTDDDVALAIFRKKNPGCGLHAAGTSVVVPDVYDLYEFNTVDITFSRPVYIPILMSVIIIDDGSLSSSTEDDVTQAILDYVNGSLFSGESCGFNQVGFGIGVNVPISRMYTPVNNVIGAAGNSYIDSLTLNGSTTNVEIAFNELSQWVESNISVVIN